MGKRDLVGFMVDKTIAVVEYQKVKRAARMFEIIASSSAIG